MYPLLSLGSSFKLNGMSHVITAVETDEDYCQQVFEYDFKHRINAENLYDLLDEQ